VDADVRQAVLFDDRLIDVVHRLSMLLAIEEHRSSTSDIGESAIAMQRTSAVA
jgi:hypothetical protein